MIDHIEFHETLKFVYELPFKMSNRWSFGGAYKGLLVPYINIILRKKKNCFLFRPRHTILLKTIYTSIYFFCVVYILNL